VLSEFVASQWLNLDKLALFHELSMQQPIGTENFNTFPPHIRLKGFPG
jgi:hypothetical protein